MHVGMQVLSQRAVLLPNSCTPTRSQPSKTKGNSCRLRAACSLMRIAWYISTEVWSLLRGAVDMVSYTCRFSELRKRTRTQSTSLGLVIASMRSEPSAKRRIVNYGAGAGRHHPTYQQRLDGMWIKAVRSALMSIQALCKYAR